jgi:hypothetical protein
LNRLKEPANNEQIKLKNHMITLDAFLIFVGAASLPVLYIWILSRWIEPAYRQDYPKTMAPVAKPVVKGKLVQQAA